LHGLRTEPLRGDAVRYEPMMVTGDPVLRPAA
jgi:hypothetical protein